MRLAAIAFLALTSCGRIGFDATDGGASGDADGSPAAVSTALPAGGAIHRLALAPDGTLYAHTQGGRIFRSDDQQSWTQCGVQDGRGIAVASDGSVWVAGNDVFVSTDRCATWQPTGIDRSASNVAAFGTDLYALVDIGVRKRAGTGWVAVPTPADGQAFRLFGGSVVSGRRVFGTLNGMVSSPDGVTWTYVPTVAPSIQSVAVAPTRSYTISAGGGITCSDGFATTWTTCNVGGNGAAIAVDPFDDQHVVAAVTDELGETTDGFATLALGKRGNGMKGMDETNIMELLYTPTGGLFAGGLRGVFFAPDATFNWQPRLTGLDAWQVLSIARAGTDVYLATSAGVLHSSAGADFTIDTVGQRYSTRTRAVAIAPDGTVLASGRSVWASRDQARTWTTLNVLDGSDVYFGFSIALAGSRVYIGTATRVIRADPPWTTWTSHPVAGQNREVVALRIVDGALWAGTPTGLFVSTDEAASFQPVAGVAEDCLALEQLADGGLVVGTDFGTYISDPTRTTWQHQGPASFIVKGLAIIDGAIVAAGFGGVFASRDRGVSWQPVAGTDGLSAISVIEDPGDGSLVIGTAGDGLVRARLP
jgi:hypothetical protein